MPGRAPSAFENPSLDPLDPALRERYGDPMDRLDDRGAFPDSRTAPSADEERMAPAPEAPLPPPAAAEAAGDRGLAKMIYRNEAATFYLVFEEGVGHYHLPQPSAAGPQLYPSSNGDCLAQPMLGNGAHLASLRLEETSDANYWHYTASDGDQLTSEWAFAKRPSRDGGYAVYRQTREGWSRYGSFSRQAVR